MSGTKGGVRRGRSGVGDVKKEWTHAICTANLQTSRASYAHKVTSQNIYHHECIVDLSYKDGMSIIQLEFHLT